MKECNAYQSRTTSCNALIKRMNKKINKSMKEGLFSAQDLYDRNMSEEAYKEIKQYYNEKGFTVDSGFNGYGVIYIVVSW